MIQCDALVDYLSELLQPAQYADYCPNGLQIEGCKEIKRIATGVTANQAFLDQAIKAKVDLCLVHHGFFWKGEDPCLIGIKRHRVGALIQHNINLLAYHLPLDGHPTLGNNIQLAKQLGICVSDVPLPDGMSPALTLMGELQAPKSGLEFAQQIQKTLSREPLHIPGRANVIKTVAWCTGAAQDCIVAAIDAGCDAFITGEVSERTVDLARESGIHFYAAGHYATEQFGVQALGQHLADRFDLTHQFIAVPNPV